MVHIMEVVPAPVQYHGTLLPRVIGILVGFQEVVHLTLVKIREEALSTQVEIQEVVPSIQVEIQEKALLVIILEEIPELLISKNGFQEAGNRNQLRTTDQ